MPRQRLSGAGLPLEVQRLLRRSHRTTGLHFTAAYAEPSLQLLGTLDGHPFFFRASDGRWSLGVGEDPVVVHASDDSHFYTDGISCGDVAEDFNTGALRFREAVARTARHA